MALASGNGIAAKIPDGIHPYAELPGLVIVGTTNPEKVQEISSEFTILSAVLGVMSMDTLLELETEGTTARWKNEELSAAFEGAFAKLLK